MSNLSFVYPDRYWTEILIHILLEILFENFLTWQRRTWQLVPRCQPHEATAIASSWSCRCGAAIALSWRNGPPSTRLQEEEGRGGHGRRGVASRSGFPVVEEIIFNREMSWRVRESDGDMEEERTRSQGDKGQDRSDIRWWGPCDFFLHLYGYSNMCWLNKKKEPMVYLLVLFFL